MNYTVEFKLRAKPEEVWDTLHQYKIDRKPDELFGNVLPLKLVKVDFRVLTDNSLGLGAIYDWKFKILGITVLRFKEKVIAWEEGKSVTYQAISGWKMLFRTELEPISQDTVVKTQIDFPPYIAHFWIGYSIQL